MTEVQGGFRSGRRCSAQWLVLRGLCEVWKKEKKNSYLAFLDSKALTVCSVRDCGIEVRKKEKKIHIWPSWIVRLMTVCGERDCGIR